MRSAFPFPDRLRRDDEAYYAIAETVRRYLTPGSSVLDFAAGACDKTAVVAALNFRCSAYDDLRDPWHLEGHNRDRIVEFADARGIALTIANGSWPYAEDSFDMVMAHDVLEHLHDPPRALLEQFIRTVRDGGYLFITVPNAVNLRKRLWVLTGRTNYPPMSEFYLSSRPWRGHIREYTKGDLRTLARYLPVSVLELRSYHHMLWKLPRPLVPLYRAVTAIFPGWRDSWLMVARVEKVGWGN